MEIKHFVADIGDVMKTFVNGFDQKVFDYKYYYDPLQGKVMFVLYVEVKEQEVHIEEEERQDVNFAVAGHALPLKE